MCNSFLYKPLYFQHNTPGVFRQIILEIKRKSSEVDRVQKSSQYARIGAC